MNCACRVHVGQLKRSRGQSVTSPGHDNILTNDNIGIGKKMEGTVFGWNQTGFKSCYILSGHLTTDGDSTATIGDSSQQRKDIENLEDLCHFLESQRKQTCKAQFRDNMFRGGTKTALESVKKRSAQDLKIPMLNNKKMLTCTTGWHLQVDLCHVICSWQHCKVLQQRLEKPIVIFLCPSWTEKRTSGAHQNYRMTILLVWLNLTRHYSKTV